MATRISLKSGNRVFCGTVEYEIISSASLTSVMARDVINGEKRVLPIKELSTHSADASPPPYTPLDCLDEEDQASALERFQKIKPAVLRKLTRKEMVELAAKHGVHVTTVYRMMTKFRETNSPASLRLRTNLRGGKGKPRIEKAVDDLIIDHFNSILKVKQVDLTKLTVTTLLEEIKKKCQALGLKPPTWRTVDDRLEKFIEARKLGARRKRRGGRHRTMAGGMFPDANFPLDVVQIDHTPLDLIIVDEEKRESIGRPYLSLAIDVYSRMVVGFSLNIDTPGIFSVGRLIAHCILPKNDFLNQVGVDASWDVFGLMGTILLDNASEFRAEDFIPFQEEYMVDIRWRPVATPEYGGHIERLAKTLNDIVHQEPGSTMGDVIKREGYDSEGHACYTLDEIEKWLTILITKVYNVKQHSALKNRLEEEISPFEKYAKGIVGDEIEDIPGIGNPDTVEDEERLRLFLLPSDHRTVQREGIELDSIFYFHDILRNLYGKKGENGKTKKYLLKRDPRRIVPIHIFDPETQEYYSIPYRDLTRPPISLWELRAAKKRCSEKGISNPNEQQIFEAYAEMRQIRDESVAKTKKARREREAEKQRNKGLAPKRLNPERQEEAIDEEQDDSFDVASLYDDASLLEGVIVKKDRQEG